MPGRTTAPCAAVRVEGFGVQPPLAATCVAGGSPLGRPRAGRSAHGGPVSAPTRPPAPREREGGGAGATRCVTPRQACPRPGGFGRNLRSKTRWFTGFCNSHQVSHFATFFIDARAEISVAESRVDSYRSGGAPAPRRGGASRDIVVFLGAFRAGVRSARARRPFPSVPGAGGGGAPGAALVRRVTRSRWSAGAGIDNDPSAGSPTETLLRLLLPLNDKVQWTSRDVAGSGPPASPRSEHFTGPFNR